jgi:hypothetical protein
MPSHPGERSSRPAVLPDTTLTADATVRLIPMKNGTWTSTQLGVLTHPVAPLPSLPHLPQPAVIEPVFSTANTKAKPTSNLTTPMAISRTPVFEPVCTCGRDRLPELRPSHSETVPRHALSDDLRMLSFKRRHHRLTVTGLAQHAAGSALNGRQSHPIYYVTFKDW